MDAHRKMLLSDALLHWRPLLAVVLLGSLLACAPTGSPVPSTPAPGARSASTPGRAEGSAAAPRATAGDLLVEVLDVGQGDALLLRGPEGKTALIDGGTGDRGEAVLPHLQARGLSALDLVVSTHPHADHIGGLDEVVRGLGVKLLLDNGLPHTTDTYARLMQAVEERGVAYKPAKLGQKLNLGQTRLEVLHPASPALSGTRSDLNSNSVVLRLSYGSACMLFTGDAEEPTEEALLHRGLGRCDVLKVAHHGGEHSTQPAFLAAVQPQVALISTGAGNDYGHPRAETLSRLASVGAPVFRTDQHGTLAVRTDGRTITVTPERGQAQTFTARGAAGGSTPSGTPTAGGLVDLNSASAQELAALPGLGEKLAQAILDDRKKHGPFASVAELDRVPGIGPATVQKLQGLVTAR